MYHIFLVKEVLVILHILKPLHTGVALSEQKVLEFCLSTLMIQSVLSVNKCACAYSMYVHIKHFVFTNIALAIQGHFIFHRVLYSVSNN